MFSTCVRQATDQLTDFHPDPAVVAAALAVAAPVRAFFVNLAASAVEFLHPPAREALEPAAGFQAGRDIPDNRPALVVVPEGVKLELPLKTAAKA